MLKRYDDQAAGLRRLFRRAAPTVLAVVGGHEACGATRVACDVACQLSARGQAVTLIDEHRSANSVACMLGIRSRYDLWQVINGDVHLDRAALAVNNGLRFVSAARLAQRGEHLDEALRARLEQCWQRLSGAGEVVVIDAVVHGGGKFSPLAAKAGLVAVVTGNGSAAIMASYLRLKSIAQAQRSARLGVLVNRAADAAQAAYIADNISALMKQQLGRATENFGFVPATAAGELGADLAKLLALLGPTRRHDRCSEYDNHESVVPAAGGHMRAAAFAI